MTALTTSAREAARHRVSLPIPWVLAAFVIVAVAAFWPTVSALLELWGNPQRQTYQHGYLVAAISIWLMARNRQRVAAMAAPGQPVVFLLAFVAGLAWAVAVLGGVQTLHMALWPAAIWLSMTAALGWRAGRMLAFPVGYLYFAVPVWDVLTPFLQSATVAANSVLTQIAGIPALIEGDEVHIAAGTFLIEGRCSGLNYFVASLAIGALYGEIHREPLVRRALQVAFIGLLAMVTNWIRVFVVIVAGHLTDMQHYLVRVDHQDFGWVLFGIVLLLFLLAVRRWPGPTDEPLEMTASVANRGPSMRLPRILLGFAAMLAGPLLVAQAQARPPAERVAIELPDQLAGGQLAGVDGGWRPVYPGADMEQRLDVLVSGSLVRVYVAGYRYQAQSRELTGHGVSLLAPGPRTWNGPERRTTTVVGTVEMPWVERETMQGRQHTLLWWNYQVGSQHVTGTFAQQLGFGLASLWTRPVSGVVALDTDCVPDCEAARKRLQALAVAGIPVIAEQDARFDPVSEGSVP